jgi:hypothetical protein
VNPPSDLSDGEVARWLERLDSSVRSLTETLPTTYVATALWVQRNMQVDERNRQLGREIGDLRTEVRSRRVSWSAVLAVAVAGAALILSVLDRMYG